ncbi:hypothetical protein [Rhodococcus jostii]|uniref:hypothetical protein n=1 Tax=Rhodococcus jostii TaxID=132919 RepID=UPI0036608021
MRSHIGYATVEVRLPDDVFDDDVAGVLAHPDPGNCRGAAVVPADKGIYLIAGLGMMNQDPPRGIDGFMAHLDAAPSPIVGEIARKAEFLTDIATRVRGSRPRVGENLTQRPDGYLLTGDAVMAFNQLYGQGMSVAACEAVALCRSLSEDSSTAGLAHRGQTAMKDVIDVVIAMAVSTDGAYEGAERIGVQRPSADDMEAGALLSRVATDDPEVALAFKRYARYLDRVALQSPSIADKLAAWKVGNREVLHDNPLVIPGNIG